MPLKHANLATTTITGNINSSVLVIPIASAAKFPTMAAGDYFWAALINTSNAVEFVLVTGITGLNVTIATGGRGLAGTTATNWVTGDRFELHIIDLSLNAVQQEAHAAVATSGTDTYTATLTNVPQAYIQYMTYLLHVGNTNTVTNPTLNLNSLGAKTIVLAGGGTVPIGLIPAEAIFRYDGTNMVLLNPKLATTLLATATASGHATLDFTNLSGYAAIMFVLEQVLPATSAVNLLVRVSTDNGVSYLSTASYDYALWVVNTAPASGPQTLTGATAMLANGNGLSNAGTLGLSGIVKAIALDNATKVKYFNFDTAYGTSGGFNERSMGMGVNGTTSAINAVRFLPSSGLIASGTIVAYGIRG